MLTEHKYPLVTIVTPSYNQGRFIEATIQSVLQQNYPNLEYLVIDGGSTDNTIDILKKYEGELKWISEKDKGQSDAINKGFRMASGEIVAWLNSDDTYEDNAIFAAVDYFQDNQDVALVYGEGDIIDEYGNKVKRFEATQEFDLWTLIHVWDYIMQPTTFFRREALQEVGYLNVNLHWCMDWDLWIKLGMRYEVGYINKVLANSREYAETKTSTGGWRRFKEIVSIMRKYGNLKFPPGWFLYGTSTLYTEMKNDTTQLIASKIMYLVHKKTFSNLPIQYKDGWLGKKYCFITPDKVRAVNLRMNPIQESQIYAIIYLNNKKSHTIKIDRQSTFYLDLTGKKMNSITIIFNKTYKPKDDSRYLSVMLDRKKY